MVQVQVQLAVAEQLALVLVQTGKTSVEGTVAGDTATVIDLAGAQDQVRAADHPATEVVVKASSAQSGAALALDQALLAVVQAGAGQLEVLRAFDDAALVEEAGGTVQLQQTGTGNTTGAVVQLRAAEAQVAFTAKAALTIIETAIKQRCRLRGEADQ
ncbi:hypothetical protein D3C80_624750 [compost metagenome]